MFILKQEVQDDKKEPSGEKWVNMETKGQSDNKRIKIQNSFGNQSYLFLQSESETRPDDFWLHLSESVKTTGR